VHEKSKRKPTGEFEQALTQGRGRCFTLFTGFDSFSYGNGNVPRYFFLNWFGGMIKISYEDIRK